jgi:hypothetical protein
MKTMEFKGFKAQIMEAPRLIGEGVHGLPSGVPLEVYPSDMFIHYPENWVKGAFVVPVKPNKGLWFNFRENSEINTAVIMTIKGVNPITGMQTSGFHLEKYETKCPKHGCNFLSERFCPECNYKWPDRSYLSSSPLWWDGWLNQKDGTVRQFFFSEEELRDVASTILGKENTVPAFGFAFYAPKEPRPESAGIYHNDKVYKTSFNGYPTSGTGMLGMGISTPAGSSTNYYCSSLSGTNLCYDSALNEVKTSGFISGGNNSGALLGACLDNVNMETPKIRSKSLSKRSMSQETGRRAVLGCVVGASMEDGLDYERERSMPAPVKEVSIGAGAKINQKLNADPYALDTWKETPDSVMTIYFVFQEKFEELKAKGVRDLEGSKEGILSNCIVG